MDNCMSDLLFFVQMEDNDSILKELKKTESEITPFMFRELLFYSIQKKCDKVFDALCEVYIAGRIDVDIDKDFSSGQNALSLCVIQNNFNYFQKLLLLGASPYKEVGLNLSKMPNALKRISSTREGGSVTPLSLMVDLSRLDMLNYIKKEADKKAFVKEALRIFGKKDKKDVFDLLMENVTLEVKDMLFDAVKGNQHLLVEALLKLNKIKTLDFVNNEAKTPLIVAVQNKGYDVVDIFKTLLEKKEIYFDINYSVNGTNPLNEALSLDDSVMIKKLLFIGASPTAGLGVYQMGSNKKEQEITPMIRLLQNLLENKEKSSKNLLYMTSIYSQVELVAQAVQLASFFGGKSIYRLLLKNKNDLSYDDIFAKKLIDSVKKDDIDMINFLLQKKVSSTDVIDNQTALHVAAREGKVEILNMFLKDGLIKKVDTPVNRVTPFETAVWHNQEETALLLLKAGAKVPLYLESGEFLLSRIIDFDMSNLLQQCVLKNSKLKEDAVLKKALWQSVVLKRNKCVKVLLDAKIDVNFENIYKTPLLVQAVKKKNYQAVNYLIEMGANINSIDNNNMTVLHYAIQNRSNLFAIWLIDKGINVDAQNKNGQTPLMLAMEKGLNDVAVRLIQSRADAAIKDVDGKKAIDYYRDFKNVIIRKKRQKEMERE